MSAKLHLAEDSLALHFLLESLEGLIHIVVATRPARIILYFEAEPRKIRKLDRAHGDTAKRKLRGL